MIKKFLIYTFATLSLTTAICFTDHCFGAKKNEEEIKNFNFIKSEEDQSNLLYNDKILLYGGIALISVSIAGMIFTFLPSKKKNKKR